MTQALKLPSPLPEEILSMPLNDGVADEPANSVLDVMATTSKKTTRAAVAERPSPYRNTPGSWPRALEQPVRSIDGAAGWLHHPNDPNDVLAAAMLFLNSPELKELCARLDAEPCLRPSGFSYLPSQYIGILLLSLIGPTHDMKSAHRYAQSHPIIREMLGFEAMSPVNAARVLRGRATPKPEPGVFPSRQSVVKFLDKWLASRAEWLIPLMHDLIAKAAFRTILAHNLDTSRFTIDTAPARSGLVRNHHTRKDEGARRRGHRHGPYFGRVWGSVRLGDVSLLLYGRPFEPESDPFLAQTVLIPKLRQLSDDFVAYARARGVEHVGFDRAGLFGDSAFNDVETYNDAYKNGFEPAFSSKLSGEEHAIIGKRHLTIVGSKKRNDPNGKSRSAVRELSNRGRFYCPCDARKPLAQRRPMTQTTNRFGRDFRIRCHHCPLRTMTLSVTRHGADKELANGRWRKGAPSTLVRTIRYDEPRAIGASFYLGEAQENSHSILRNMGLLMKENSGKRKHITGKFRYDFWYALGGLVNNLIIAENLARGRVSREKLDWHDLRHNGLRNGASANAAKKADRENRRSKTAEIAARNRSRNTSDPPVAQAA